MPLLAKKDQPGGERNNGQEVILCTTSSLASACPKNWKRCVKTTGAPSKLRARWPYHGHPALWQEQSAEELHQLLQSAVAHIPAFHIRGSGLGSFGTRVLFVNVDLSDSLQELHKALAESLGQAGVSVDRRPYHPHITLATRLTPGQFARCQREVEGFSPTTPSGARPSASSPSLLRGDGKNRQPFPCPAEHVLLVYIDLPI